MEVMKKPWTYAEIFDLEYFLARDRDMDQTVLHERDRQIYLTVSNDMQPAPAPTQPAELIRLWLDHMGKTKTSDPPDRSVGRSIVESLRSLSYLLLLVGLIFGLVAALSFLSYGGTTPVNVLHFLFLFVFSQLALLAIVMLAALLRLTGMGALPNPIISLYAHISDWFIARTTALGRRLPAQQRSAGTSHLGILKRLRSVHGALVYWPVFRLTQTTMVGFNFGLLAATLYKIAISDVAFGWQSTIQFSEAFIYKAVQILSLPWTWLVPANYAHPSLSEIAGSRIVLKEGIYHLATTDLVSWWPFLLFCLLFYGFLLRLALLAIAAIFERRTLQQAAAQQLTTRPEMIHLIQRLQRPLVSSQAGDSETRGSKLAVDDNGSEQMDLSPDFPLVLLLASETAQDISLDDLSIELNRLGFSISERLELGGGHDEDTETEQKLRRSSWDESGLLLIMESWMVPIQDNLDMIRQLRQAVGRRTPIFIGLIGRPAEDGHAARPDPLERRIWQQKLDTLADPALSIFELSVAPSNQNETQIHDT
jgi:hypothetical protein